MKDVKESVDDIIDSAYESRRSLDVINLISEINALLD